VKNTLSYMDYAEMQTKIRLCLHLGLKPVFVVRMAPGHWFQEVRRSGGFILAMQYQLYPPLLKGLAGRIREELELQVDTPRAIQEGTMRRFLNWHVQQIKT
jgi:hypothetical protein